MGVMFYYGDLASSDVGTSDNDPSFFHCKDVRTCGLTSPAMVNSRPELRHKGGGGTCKKCMRPTPTYKKCMSPTPLCVSA